MRGGAPADGSSTVRSARASAAPTAPSASIPAARAAAAQPLRDWPEFGLDPQRSDVSERPAGITAANVARLHRVTVRLPGTADSSPIYLHAALVGGAARYVAVVTTTYGKTARMSACSRSWRSWPRPAAC